MTEIKHNSDQFKQHRYSVNARLIPKGGKEEDMIDLSEGVMEVRIIKDFDSQVFPYYKIIVGVSVSQASKIQEVWREARVYLTLHHFFASRKGEQMVDVDALDDYIKDIEFQIMTMDGAPTNVPTEQAGSQPQNAPSVQLSMELSPVLALSVNKGINNGAYHDASVGDLVALLTQRNRPSGKTYKFFMATPDNPRRYESIMLPPRSYIQAIRYLDEVHGLYRGKLSVFLDADAGYIMSSEKAIAPPKGKPATVMLEMMNASRAGPHFMTGSGRDDEAKVYRFRTAQRIAVDVAGPARKEVNGERIKIVRATHSERTGSECSNLTSDRKSGSDKPKERVVWLGYDNPLTEARLKIASRENYAPAVLTFEGVDLAALSPCLQWTLVASDDAMRSVEGRWRMQAVEMVLTKRPMSKEPCSNQVMVRLVPASIAEA